MVIVISMEKFMVLFDFMKASNNFGLTINSKVRLYESWHKLYVYLLSPSSDLADLVWRKQDGHGPAWFQC